MIEQVLMKVTLKAGNKIWEEGRILGPSPPVPQELIDEAIAGTGTVEVLKASGDIRPNRLVFVAEIKRDKDTTTMASMGSPAPKPAAPPKKQEPKPLLRRKK